MTLFGEMMFLAVLFVSAGVVSVVAKRDIEREYRRRKE